VSLQAVISEAQPVTEVAAKGAFSLFLKSDDSLWAMGQDNFGQLGDGINHLSTNAPEQIVASGVTTIAGGSDFSLFVKSNGSLWAMGDNSSGQLGNDTGPFVRTPELIVAGPLGQVSIQPLSGGTVSLTFWGLAGTNYVLDRSFSLSPANWMPQITNSAGLGGLLLFTNTPDPTTNNFWRIRSLP
jgi:hypothetical protein